MIVCKCLFVFVFMYCNNVSNNVHTSKLVEELVEVGESEFESLALPDGHDKVLCLSELCIFYVFWLPCFRFRVGLR